MPEMKTLGGYEVVDAKAREDIEALKNAEVDLTGYATEAYVDEAIANIDISGIEVAQVDYHLLTPTKGEITDAKTIECLDRWLNGEKPVAYLNDRLLVKVQVIPGVDQVWCHSHELTYSTAGKYIVDYHYYFIKQDGVWIADGHNDTAFSFPIRVSDLTNDAQYATESYVRNAIAALRAELTGGNT